MNPKKQKRDKKKVQTIHDYSVHSYSSSSSDSDEDYIPNAKRDKYGRIIQPIEKLSPSLIPSPQTLFVVFVVEMAAFWVGFGLPVFCILVLVLIVRQTRTSSSSNSEISAYSVFNREQTRLVGDRTADSIEKQLRSGGF